MSNKKTIFSFESIAEEDELINVNEITNPQDVINDNVVIDNTDVDNGERHIDDLSATIDETDEIVTTLESFNSVLSKKVNLDKTGAKIVEIAIENFCSRVGYKKKVFPALESFGGTLSKKEGTQLAIEGIKEFAVAAWEVIKKAFSKILEWLTDLFKKIITSTKAIYNGLNNSLSNLNDFATTVSSGKKVAIEDNNGYDINKPLTMHVGNFGTYLGNNKKDIITYIDELKDIDSSILDVIKHCNDDLDINISAGAATFKHPFTLEQKEFFKDKVPFTTTQAKVVPLAFKKGFIWKIEGTSVHSTNNATETLEVNAGVERIPYVYDIEEIDVLTIGDIKVFLSKIKYDLESDGKNTHMLASKVLKSINDKLREIEKLSNSNKSENEEEYKANRAKFAVAKQSLNALKAIEIGYWQYKNQTTVKIKEYCDASVKARKKDYSSFNEV